MIDTNSPLDAQINEIYSNYTIPRLGYDEGYGIGPEEWVIDFAGILYKALEDESLQYISSLAPMSAEFLDSLINPEINQRLKPHHDYGDELINADMTIDAFQSIAYFDFAIANMRILNHAVNVASLLHQGQSKHPLGYIKLKNSVKMIYDLMTSEPAKKISLDMWG